MHHNYMKLSLRNIMLLASMLLSAGLGAVLRPTISLADERPPIDLAAMVPRTFGEWREETNQQAQVVNPQQKGVIDKIYSQTLSRTYVNPKGYRIMLSIAYGKNQSDALQLHKPEVCYPAQGFLVLNRQAVSLELVGKTISAVHLGTKLGLRQEQITYWTIVGDYVTKGGIDKKLVELRYAMDGKIPDGMLVRISSIDVDTTNAYALQHQFADAMTDAIEFQHRKRFAGIPNRS